MMAIDVNGKEFSITDILYCSMLLFTNTTITVGSHY